MSNLAFWQIFSTMRSVSSGPSSVDRRRPATPARPALVPQRHVAALARCGGQRQADQRRPHRRPARRSRYRARRGRRRRRRVQPRRAAASAVVTVSYGPKPTPASPARLGHRQCRLRTRRRRLVARGGRRRRAVQAQPRRSMLRKPCCCSHRRQRCRSASRWISSCRSAAASACRRAASPARARCAPSRRARSACRAASTASSPARRPARSPGRRYSLISCAAPFGPMPGTPGTLSIGVADQRLHLDHLVGRDAELLHHLGRADRLLLDRVEHLHARPDQLHQVLVGGDDGHLPARLGRGAGIGGDQVVGLPVRELDRPARRTPRSPRAPGRIAGSVPRAAAGAAPCRRRTAGCGRSCRPASKITAIWVPTCSFSSFASMLVKPNTAFTGVPSGRVIGGSAWKARKMKPDPSIRIRCSGWSSAVAAARPGPGAQCPPAWPAPAFRT